MLHALLRSKRPRGAVPDPGDDTDTSSIDADLLSAREDPLTATVFERLSYLPEDLVWRPLPAPLSDPTVVDSDVHHLWMGSVDAEAENERGTHRR